MSDYFKTSGKRKGTADRGSLREQATVLLVGVVTETAINKPTSMYKLIGCGVKLLPLISEGADPTHV